MNKLKQIISKTLVVFALISLGYIWGKHAAGNQPAASVDDSGNYIQIYYMHGTKRCYTCNTIEAMTVDAVNSQYSIQLSDGAVKISSINFQKRADLAEKFQISSNCVVVAEIKEGKIEGYKRLDDIWTKKENKITYDNYIRTAVDSFLNPEQNTRPLVLINPPAEKDPAINSEYSSWGIDAAAPVLNFGVNQ